MDGTGEQDTAPDLAKLLAESQRRENRLQTLIDMIPAFAWSCSPGGTNHFLDQRWHEYTGCFEDAPGWDGSGDSPEDLNPITNMAELSGFRRAGRTRSTY